MADFKSGQGVKTHEDDDAVFRLADGQSGATATDFLTIAQDGDTIVPGTNDFGAPVLFCDANGDLVIPKTDANGNLVVVFGEGAKANSYQEETDLATDASANHDKIITTSKIARKVSVVVSSAGCVKYEVGTWNGAAFTVAAVLWTQPASPTACCDVCIDDFTGDGTNAIRIRSTNKDDTTNIYTSMCFCENAS